MVLNNYESFLFAGLSPSEFGELSLKDKDFVSLEISQRFSSGLTGVSLSQAALSKLFSHIFSFDYGFDFACLGAAEDLDKMLGKLKSSNWNDLPADFLPINQNSFVAEDVYNSGEFACLRTVVDSGHATHFHEFGISLNR